MRQPYTERSRFTELNESYVFCLRRKAGEIAREVKKSLEKEGYEGDLMSVVDSSADSAKAKDGREAQMRDRYRRFYKKFEGKVYLPRFAVKEGNDYAVLDYYGHLVSKVDVSKFDYASIAWDLSDMLARTKDSIYRVTIDQDLERVDEEEAVSSENDKQVTAWLVASLSFDYFSFKQLRVIVEKVVEQLLKKNKN